MAGDHAGRVGVVTGRAVPIRDRSTRWGRLERVEKTWIAQHGCGLS
jgi:hypothetical protein